MMTFRLFKYKSRGVVLDPLKLRDFFYWKGQQKVSCNNLVVKEQWQTQVSS